MTARPRSARRHRRHTPRRMTSKQASDQRPANRVTFMHRRRLGRPLPDPDACASRILRRGSSIALSPSTPLRSTGRMKIARSIFAPLAPLVALAVVLNALLCLCGTAPARRVQIPSRAAVHACCASPDDAAEQFSRGRSADCAHGADCHCKTSAAAWSTGTPSAALDAIPPVAPLQVLPTCLRVAIAADASSRPRFIAFDAAPPRLDGSLLRLHCALNC